MRKKHFKDRKANTHYVRWLLGLKKQGCKFDNDQGKFIHSDRVIEGKLKKQKLYEKIIKQEINDTP